jgi:hypothetical protein
MACSFSKRRNTNTVSTRKSSVVCPSPNPNGNARRPSGKNGLGRRTKLSPYLPSPLFPICNSCGADRLTDRCGLPLIVCEQNLQDEITTLTLELNQSASRNDALKKDNASLLQRWVDKMQQEAEKMNLENETGFVRLEDEASPLLRPPDISLCSRVLELIVVALCLDAFIDQRRRRS